MQCNIHLFAEQLCDIWIVNLGSTVAGGSDLKDDTASAHDGENTGVKMITDERIDLSGPGNIHGKYSNFDYDLFFIHQY